MFSKGIMAAILVLVFLIPVAFGISVSIGGSQSGNSFSDTTTFNALDHDSLSIHSVVNGAAMAQDASGSGDLHKSFVASSHRGERAQITADVVNAGNWEYTLPGTSAGDTTASVTGFVLSATNADTIRCNTGASDRLGDKASAAVEVSQGSLINYHGDAFASSSGVNAMQSFDSAEGTQVAAKERASNPTGSTITNTNVQNGGIFGYTNYQNTFVDPDLMMGTCGQFELARGDAIGFESSAYKATGYRSNAKMDVQNGQVSGHLSAADVGFVDFETYVFQYIPGWAEGRVIGLAVSSSNAERDVSNSKVDIRGTETEPGSIGGYSDFADSYPDSVFTLSYFGGANGDEVYLASSASNKENDRAYANMHAIGNGQINIYVASSGATAKTASASDGNANRDTSISGNEIGYDASASDAARNNASDKTLALDGSIVGIINSAAVDNTFGQDLTASQSATIVSGSMTNIDTRAINAAKEKQSLHNHFVNPLGITYTNTAGVRAGKPTVLQTAIA